MSRLQERIENFNRAFELYTEAVNAYNSEYENILYHLALTQSFEICFELAWKVLKDYLLENGIEKHLPKEIIKEAFAAEVIKDGQLWIDMLKNRNACSHEYNHEKINKILNNIAATYYQELARFKGWVNDD